MATTFMVGGVLSCGERRRFTLLGRSVHENSDANMEEMREQLKREEVREFQKQHVI